MTTTDEQAGRCQAGVLWGLEGQCKEPRMAGSELCEHHVEIAKRNHDIIEKARASMSASNDRKLEAAKEALNEYFSDSSVTQQETLEGLIDMRDEVDNLISLVRHDLKAQGD